MKRTNLLEAKLGVELAEAAAGDHEAVLADNATVVASDAAVRGGNKRRRSRGQSVVEERAKDA